MAGTNAMAMIEVVCPHCATSWAVPRERFGPGGARIHCARCEGAFEWRRARDHEIRAAHPAVPEPNPVVANVNAWSEWDLDTWLEDAAAPAAAPPPAAVLARATPPPPAASAVAELDTSDVTPDLVARLAVEELVSARAEDLLAAYDHGTLFASFGPELVHAWAQCRARLGESGDPAVFRAALLARIGVDLPGWEDRG